MFDSQEPVGKRRGTTMLVVIVSVFALLGLLTWFYTQ
jgi:hypothetical protein